MCYQMYFIKIPMMKQTRKLPPGAVIAWQKVLWSPLIFKVNSKVRCTFQAYDEEIEAEWFLDTADTSSSYPARWHGRPGQNNASGKVLELSPYIAAIICPCQFMSLKWYEVISSLTSSSTTSSTLPAILSHVQISTHLCGLNRTPKLGLGAQNVGGNWCGKKQPKNGITMGVFS